MDLPAPPSAPPTRPVRDPDQTHRAQKGGASLPGLSIRSPQSPAAGCSCPSRTPGGLRSPSSQSRAVADRQAANRRPAFQARRVELRRGDRAARGAGAVSLPAVSGGAPGLATRTLRVRPPGSRRPRCPLQPAARESRRCTGSNAGHDDRLRRGTTQRVGGSGVHLPRLLHR